jgi:hypothetical protein
MNGIEGLSAVSIDCNLLKVKIHALMEKHANAFLEKHDDGIFLKEITERHPSWYSKTQNLLNSYRELIIELGQIIALLEIECPNVEEKLIKWAKKFKDYDSQEICLLMDSHNLELGSGHH